MKIDLKIIVFASVFAIMLWALMTFKPQPPAPQPNPILGLVPKESPKPSKPEPEPKPGIPEKPEIKLPAKGVALPNSPVFSKTKNGFEKTGALANAYFRCEILNLFEDKGVLYYLIQIKQSGFREDFHILEKESVLMDGQASPAQKSAEERF